jgi:hypothetical protein
LPPFEGDAIPEEDIDSFQMKGLIGWNYITNQLLNSSIIEEKLEAMKEEKETIQNRRKII